MSEQLVWRANRVAGSLRAVGGVLAIQAARLVFLPGRLAQRVGEQPWMVDLHDIEDVQVLGGRLRRRLVVTADGEETAFVVRGAEQVAARIRKEALLPEGAGDG